MPPTFPPNRGRNPMNINREDNPPTWLILLFIAVMLSCIFVVIPTLLQP